MNEALREKEEKEITLGEFLVYLGIWLFMTTLSGFKMSDFWSLKEIELWSGASYGAQVFCLHNVCVGVYGSKACPLATASGRFDR